MRETGKNRAIPDIIQRADALYAARERREKVRACVEILSATAAPPHYEVDWRLGRALFFLGQEARDKTESRAHHAQAVKVCERAINLQPQRVEGYFWLGVNLALLAQHENLFNALRHALRARHTLERALQLNSAYHAAGPLRVLARLEHKLPRLLGGGTERARAHFEEAINLAPENTVTRIYFAQMLLEMGAKDDARIQLELILNTPHDITWAYEASRDMQLAREMLKTIS